MPISKWSNKEERQYEHIKKGARQRGASEKRAKSIAGATINKQRRQQGRTPNRTTQGTGNPNVALENRSKQEIYNIAKERGIRGRSKMSKDQLVEAVRAR